MRISVKGRYALAAVVEIARNSGSEENISVVNIAGALGISKIYLEQVFTLLKKAQLLVSIKGARGGYQLARSPGKMTAWEILSAVETTLFDAVENTVMQNAPEIEIAMKTLVFEPLDASLQDCLTGVTVQNLLDFTMLQRSEQAYMLNM